MIQCEGERNTGGNVAQTQEWIGHHPTQKVKVVISVVLLFFRPTMHAFRPRSQQAGA